MKTRQPTKNEILSVLKACKDGVRISYQDVDGEVSCPFGQHQIACLKRAIEIVLKHDWKRTK